MTLRYQLSVYVVLLVVAGNAVTGSCQDLPPALQSFRPHSTQPVFVGRPGKWDAAIRERGWIIKEGDKYRLWYTGYDPDQLPVTMKLGMATSDDGIAWKRFSDQPIFDKAWVEDMMIVVQDDVYFMFAEGTNDQAYLLRSTDGVEWIRVGTLDVRLQSGEKIPDGPLGTPTAIVKDGIWHLFYERRDQGVWLATSTDMKVWTNVTDDPLIVPGPEMYDGLMIAMNQIVPVDGRYYAVMHGTGTKSKPRDWCTYFAVSDDLRSWKKCHEGPVLPVKENKSSGVLVHDGQRFRLYTMHARVDLHLAP